MYIQLNHPFVNICPDIDSFFKVDKAGNPTIFTINAFCDSNKKEAKKHAAQLGLNGENEYKGSMLELFVEYMIKTGAEDNRIGIYDYEPTLEDDFGVDGSGLGENGNPATVQAKFRRGDYTLYANEDHLSNFLTSSWVDYNVLLEDDKNMLIVTTGQKVDERSLETMLKGKVRVLNREDLRNMFDNKSEWWIRFYESVKGSQIQKDTTPPLILRDHQQEAVDVVMENGDKGKIILPTGVGKTIIEAEIISKTIKKCKKEGDASPVIKVNASRILLCFQLFHDMLPRFLHHKIEAKYVNFNSGQFKDDSKLSALMRKEGMQYRKIESTTSTRRLKKIYKQCKKEGIPLIVFSTYHSAEKFAEAKLPVKLTINDEAHNLVSNNFHRVAELPTERNFFFTATEKVTDTKDGYGMNNETTFATTIYSKSAREMIAAGEMVAPALHIVRSSNRRQLDDDFGMMFESISEAFFAHERKIKALSCSPSDIGAKILVVCRDQMALQEMFKTNEFKQFRLDNPDINVFALSSDFGIYNNGEYEQKQVTNIKKHHLLKDMKAMGNNEKALIFHVDMIGEGIDVPGITGVMPFRNCDLVKFLQNLGRGTRLHPLDRARYYAGEIEPLNSSSNVDMDTCEWIKPFTWLIIPSYMIDTDGMESRFTKMIKQLRSEYGYIPQQHTVINNGKGLSDEDDIDVVNIKSKAKKQQDSGIDGFDHEFEKVSAIERIIYDMDVDAKVKNILDDVDNVVLD